MTTEDDFQRAIDAQPDDWQTRLVFADWLDEQGDRRATGYRALVAIGRRAMPCQMAPEGDTTGLLLFIYGSERMDIEEFRIQYGLCLLPLDWLKLLDGSLYETGNRPLWKHFRTRHEADDAAARAFTRLSVKRRLKLLQPPA